MGTLVSHGGNVMFPLWECLLSRRGNLTACQLTPDFAQLSSCTIRQKHLAVSEKDSTFAERNQVGT